MGGILEKANSLSCTREQKTIKEPRTERVTHHPKAIVSPNQNKENVHPNRTPIISVKTVERVEESEERMPIFTVPQRDYSPFNDDGKLKPHPVKSGANSSAKPLKKTFKLPQIKRCNIRFESQVH